MFMQFRRFEMILAGVFAVVLGAGPQMQPQTAPPPTTGASTVTQVMVMTSRKAGVATQDVSKLAPDEVRVAVQLYLDGKIDQWYTRSDGKGAVIFLRCTTVDQAKAIISSLPLAKAGYLDVEYIPVGPFSGLRVLSRIQPATEGPEPH
jgi:hypothetical protein